MFLSSRYNLCYIQVIDEYLVVIDEYLRIPNAFMI